MWNDSDTRAKVFDLYALNVNVIDQNLTFDYFNYSTKTETDGTLASPCPANNPDSLPSLSLETQVFQDHLSIGSVLEEDVLKLDFTLHWPVWVPPLEGLEAHVPTHVLLRYS